MHNIINKRFPFTSARASSHISLDVILGYSSSKTLSLTCVFKTHNFIILIDGGNTHNFIQDRLDKFLGLPILDSPNFHVMVGNGDRLQCSSYCPNISICLNSTKF